MIMSDSDPEIDGSEREATRNNPTEGPFQGLSAEQAFQLGNQASQLTGNYQSVGGGDISSREELASRIPGSTQFGGQRDMNTVLGYPDDVGFEDYLHRYLRQDIARRIVNAPADKAWSQWPTVTDDDEGEEETPFEEAVRTIHEECHALEALRNTDRYSGIGHVGALVIGFADGQPLNEEVQAGSLSDDPSEAIAYLTPLHEGALKSITLVDDETDDRFGEPESFSVDFSEMDTLVDSTVSVTNTRRERTVHHSRVVFVQPDRPRLEPVYNRLMDLEKVTGASAELFWRGADYGLALNMDGKALGQMGTEQRRELQDDIEAEAEAYYHGLQPFLKMAGVDVERLGGEDVDPTGVSDLILSLISGTIQMPKRILTGSERGELASTQDRSNWLGHIAELQQHWEEPHILRPFLDRLIEYGVVPDPSIERYEVEWPNLFELNSVEEAEVMEKKANAFNTAASGLMASRIATEGEVRQEILDWGIEVGSETGEVEEEQARIEEEEQAPEEVVVDPEDEDEDGVSDRVDETDPDIVEEFRRRVAESDD